MTSRLVMVGVVVSAFLIVLILSLIRQRRLQERYALLWLGAAAGIVVFGVWTDALEALAGLFGIAYPPSALFLIVAIFLGLVLLDTAIVISRLASRVTSLAQSLAMVEERVRRLEDGEAGLEPAAEVEAPSATGAYGPVLAERAGD